MNINLIRLYADKNDPNVKSDDDLITDLNEQLIEEDILLLEEVKNSPVDVVLVESDNVKDKFFKIYNKLNKFIYLICFSKGRSFSAALEINQYLTKNKANFIFDDSPMVSLQKILPTFVDISRTYHELNGKNFGLFIEESGDSLLPKFDEGKLYKKLGISVIKVGKEELFKEYKKYKSGNPPHLLKMKKMVKNSSALNKTLYLYGALSRLAEKYHLSGLTIDSNVIKEELGISPSLALALLNEQGIICNDKTDLGVLVSSFVAYKLSNHVPYVATPIKTDYENKILSVNIDYPSLNQVKTFNIINPYKDYLEIQSVINIGESSIVRLDYNCEDFFSIGSEIKSSDEDGIKLFIDEIPLFGFVRDAGSSQIVLVGQDISVPFSALFSYINSEK